ncbi:DNA polymerase-3 subunit gamma/tau [Krasilnikovia cinnamomea]|uniref:DNA polymerase III subunit gamma/tau n=1 Tax=Krasilnikovia cinnamomea TaxID=349313 RepID=A0A4Q7ZJP9_9ACTN|nr:DNA polymerase III subunit gamma and tau [Krasilnikovia cinnamomea]RZU50734.1 DNA polymerase-3 subunit gamma/tau [Krasilnikovia cinnamomea]
MALALYRKYRPRTFAEVIGQEHVTEPLSQALRSGRLHHAYLFSGPRGCGKTSSARILARSLNCVHGPTPEPCGVCPSCRSLATDGSGSIDVIEIDAASHGGVDDARELREKAFFAPASSRFKIYVIDEAHMVSSAGFNALLKLVEEPPDYVKFIFATTEPEKVLGTIRSRTHHYPFRLIPPAVLRPYLAQLCEAEGIAVEPAVFPLVVRAGGGSARDTLSVLDQLIAGAGPEGVTYGRAVALLGVTDAALIDEMCDALAAGDGAAAYATIDRVAEAGHDPRRFASDLLERLRDLIVLQQVPDAVAKGLIDGPADQLEAMGAQATRLGPATLSRCADIVHNGLVEMRGTTAPRLLLELVTARMLLPGAEDSTGALLQRLERIERRVTLSGDAGTAPVAGQTAPVAGQTAAHAGGGSPPVVAAEQAGGGGGTGLSAARAAAAAAGRRSATEPSPGTDPGAPAESAPAEGQPAPSHPPQAPSQPSKGPGQLSQAPGQPSRAPGQPARALGQPSQAPGASAHETVRVPTGSVQAQAEVVQAPSGPVQAPTGTVQAQAEVVQAQAGSVEAPEPKAAARSVAEPPAAPTEIESTDTPDGRATADPGRLTVDAVREAWPEIMTAVGHKSKKIAALAQGATVRDLDGQTLVLTFRFPAHAKMVASDPTLISDALYESLGGQWQIRCDVSGEAGGTASPPSTGRRSVPSQGGSRGPAPDARRSPQAGSAAPGGDAAGGATAGPVSGSTRRREPSPQPAPGDEGDDWPEPARPGGGSTPAEPPTPTAEDRGPGGSGDRGPTADGPGPGGPADRGPTANGNGVRPRGPGAAAASGGLAAARAAAANAARLGGARAGAAGLSAPAGTTPKATGTTPKANNPTPKAHGPTPNANSTTPRANGTTPKATPGGWSDGSPAEEPPYDPEYDGPVRGVAAYEGFDPGDEPLDDVIDEKTARESSEQQAVRLLQEAFGAEKIGEA